MLIYDKKIKNVVIVDDEENVRTSLSRMMKIENYRVKTFSSAEDCIKYLNDNLQNPMELLITDYRLTGLSGIGLLTKVKKIYPEISMILMTGYGEKELVKESFRKGADEFIDKPFSPSDLLKCIKNIEKKRRSQLNLYKKFIFEIMHELNNKITSVMGWAGFLKDSHSNKSEVQEAYNVIFESVVQIKKMMKNLLNIEGKKIQYEFKKIYLRELINFTLKLVQIKAQKRNVKIIKNIEDTFFIADRNKLNQVLLNLLLNAIKYSPENTKIIISSKVNKESVKICIADEGIGIPAQYKEEVFQKNFRVSKDKFGNGIGLFVVKKIINEHNGKIIVRDNKPNGSAFVITLPLKLEVGGRKWEVGSEK